MPLIYSFVARETTILAEYTAYTGKYGRNQDFLLQETVMKLQCLGQLSRPVVRRCTASAGFALRN
jgi:hypothetical protein